MVMKSKKSTTKENHEALEQDEMSQEEYHKLEKSTKALLAKHLKTNGLSGKQALKLGHSFLRLEAYSGENRKVWSARADAEYPEIATRRRQRYMELARNIDKSPPETFFFLSQKMLIRLSKLSNPKSIEEFLKKKDIDYKFDHENIAFGTEFKRQIANLVEDTKKKGSGEKTKRLGFPRRVKKPKKSYEIFSSKLKKFKNDDSKCGSETTMKIFCKIYKDLRYVIARYNKKNSKGHNFPV
jgi:hypothetical protein